MRGAKLTPQGQICDRGANPELGTESGRFFDLGAESGPLQGLTRMVSVSGPSAIFFDHRGWKLYSKRNSKFPPWACCPGAPSAGIGPLQGLACGGEWARLAEWPHQPTKASSEGRPTPTGL